MWSKILNYKFHIGWVFGFLLGCMALLLYALSKQI